MASNLATMLNGVGVGGVDSVRPGHAFTFVDEGVERRIQKFSGSLLTLKFGGAYKAVEVGNASAALGELSHHAIASKPMLFAPPGALV